MFGALDRAVARRLSAGRTVVVDATNLERHARRPLLALATYDGIPAAAIVFEIERAEAIARDRRRHGRTVGEDVIVRQHERLAWLLASGQLEDEGFVVIHRLAGVEAIDRARIVRSRAG